MLAGALMRGAAGAGELRAVIDHPLFGAGLAAFFLGVLVCFVQALAAPPQADDAAWIAGLLPPPPSVSGRGGHCRAGRIDVGFGTRGFARRT
jgi:hypothetical protein